MDFYNILRGSYKYICINCLIQLELLILISQLGKLLLALTSSHSWFWGPQDSWSYFIVWESCNTLTLDPRCTETCIYSLFRGLQFLLSIRNIGRGSLPLHPYWAVHYPSNPLNRILGNASTQVFSHQHLTMETRVQSRVVHVRSVLHKVAMEQVLL